VRRAYPDLPSHALEEVVAALGLLSEVQALCPDRAAHDALYDAVASAVLLQHLLAQPAWAGMTLRDLARQRPGRAYRQARKQT